MKPRELNVECILATIASISIAIVLCIIVVTPPVIGYEISIYDDYPAYFWFFITAAITSGVIILLIQAFAEKKSRWWLLGLAIVIFANSIFLLLPMFRGYVLYGRWDTLSHLGQIRDILTIGYVGKSNFYPVTHILGAVLTQVTGLSLESIPSLFTVIFSGIYILNMCLLSKVTSDNFGQVLLTTSFASPFIYGAFHSSIHPSFFSWFMVPCLLYLYQKREKLSHGKRRNTVLLLFIGFFITLFHPVTALFVIAILLTLGFARVLYFRFLYKNSPKSTQGTSLGKNVLEMTLIMLIMFSVWYLSYAFIQRSLKAIFDWLIYQIGTSPFAYWMKPLAEAGLTPFQTFELFVNRFGAPFLFLLIASFACISVISNSLARKHNIHAAKFFYTVLFLIAFLIGTMELFGYFVEYEPLRVARFPLLIGTILSGLVVYDFINGVRMNIKTKEFVKGSGITIAIAVIMIVMVALSLGSVYGSPRVWDVNHQVTRMDVAGTEWFGKFKNPGIVVVTNIPEQIGRFEDYKFGVESSTVTRATVDPERLPSHFGYDKYNQIAAALNFQDRYLIIYGLDKAAVKLFASCPAPKIHVYTEEDFAKLDSDPGVARLYCNGEFEVWRVYGGG